MALIDFDGSITTDTNSTITDDTDKNVNKIMEGKVSASAKYFNVIGRVFINYSSNDKLSSIGLNNLTLHLYDKYNNLIASQNTSKLMSINGIYAFDNLLPGKYRIVATIPKKIKIGSKVFNYKHEANGISRTHSVTFNITNKNIKNAFIYLPMHEYK